MDHHERLDGFGYPQGKSAGQISDHAQILAVAEMLGGMMERGRGVLHHAEVAVKLIHGEFSRPVIEVVSRTFKECRAAEVSTDGDHLRDALQHARVLGVHFHNVVTVQEEYAPHFALASQSFNVLMAQANERFDSIRKAWSSTGMDVQSDGAWLMNESPAMQREVAIILREIIWRLRELEQELHSRVGRHAPGDLPMLERFLKDVSDRRMLAVEQMTQPESQ
jgi:hypothetical protein